MARLVSHEMRNALSVLYNVETGLRRGAGAAAPEAETLLGILHEEVGRLDRLARDLVALARPAQLSRSDASVREVLERAVAEARARCAGAGDARVCLEVAPEAERASIDAERLQEAIAWLIRNGIQAAPEPAVVRVAAYRSGPRLCVDVIDHGPGIAPADAGRVFEPFFTTTASGTGLSLPLARRIARDHGGDLRALPGPDGVGACFRFEIPASAGGG
jgi:signal transduction histidine kinase